MPQTIAFIGASGGCGLAALKRAVVAGHTCVALCRKPEKMDVHFPSKPGNLLVLAGNAHDSAAVSSCLVRPEDETQFVDAIHISVGAYFNPRTFKVDDPDVCKKATACVLGAIKTLREENGCRGRPLYTAISTTGISKFGRDVPMGMLPMYKWMLSTPHADKEAMEKQLVASGERFVMVRPSFLLEESKAKPYKNIRVGVENPGKGIEAKEIGYAISRDDVGRWVYENLLKEQGKTQYEGKAVSITW
ncbi:hypothetical protein NLG97_g5437 [Lecanicillium saksenae]|uniref:Uncharacterized protein n=1 Tax=Lecanicillium saksenae TaxID=468837 RepID=A0ACC1QTM6_9HYPO|nr:hypothetical protein NLG97_g5437 [Lecanicillium saksenae]